MRHFLCLAAISAVILTVSGCGRTPQQQAEAVQQAVARAVAEERWAAEARLKQAISEAEAKTLVGSMQQSNRSVETARREGFETGELAGRAAAEAEASLKIEATRKEAYTLGRDAGEAAAAGPNFERGLAVGAKQGRLEGAKDAAVEYQAKLENEIKEATETTTKTAYADGFQRGQSKAEIRQMANQNIPWMLLTTTLIVAAFYVLSKRDRFSARTADQLREVETARASNGSAADRQFMLTLLDRMATEEPATVKRLTNSGDQ